MSQHITPGMARLKVLTEAGRSVYVGPFDSLAGARRMAQDLAADSPAVISVRVEHRQQGGWKPAWAFYGGGA